MRKSLGEKRKQISDGQIADIVRIYGNFDHQVSEGDEARCKIFPNESFGFMRITVERPLRVHWEVTDDTLAVVEAEKKVTDLDADDRERILDLLRPALGQVHPSDSPLAKLVAAAVDHVPQKQQAGVKKAVLGALMVRDTDADPQTDKKGNPEPDPDLRDNENVPLPRVPVVHEPDPSHRLATPEYRLAVEEYVQTEVLPYVADAWVDHAKTKLGYEIPLTRHFYVYIPPRPLEEIDAEIRSLEAEIQALLAEVTE